MTLRLVLLSTVLGASAILLPLHGGAAQEDAGDGVRVTGHVVDRSTGADLSSVSLTLTPTDTTQTERWEQLSDSTGRFTVGTLPPGRYDLHVAALGFSDVTHIVLFEEDGEADLHIEMVPAALELEAIVVTATRSDWLAEEGFYERRDRGLGYSLTRAEIEARGPYMVSDLFYGIPGADVISERTGWTPARVLLRGRCVPQVVLNGSPFGAPIPVDQVVSVNDLEAMEVYHGASGPIRYSNSSCGTVMLWTRRTQAGEGAPLTWKRLLATAGIVAWIAWSAW